MKTIPLSRGLFAMVDDADFDAVCGYKWHALSCNGLFYAARSVKIGDVRRTILMHRMLMAAPVGANVDHENGNTLDNQRMSNLRLCPQSKNIGNAKLRKNNTSGFKGVVRCPPLANGKMWRAEIMIDRKHVALGWHPTPQDAARAYDAKALELFGEFARTNAMLGLI